MKAPLAALLVGTLLFSSAAADGSENTDEQEKILQATPLSMGQPARYRIGAGFLVGYQEETEDPTGRIFLNITPEGYLPNIGIDLFSLEGSVGFVGGDFESALAYYMRIPYLRLGVEYNFLGEDFEFVMSIQYALRRGGIFGGGEELRLDYHTGRKETLGGFVVNQPGRRYRPTRPIYKWAFLPKGEMPDPVPSVQETGLPDNIEAAVQDIEHGIMWLDRYLTPRFIADDIAQKATVYRDHLRLDGHTFDEEDARYHEAMDRAFTLSAGGDPAIGRQLALAAEATIFKYIVAPYNSYFGMNKKPDEPTGFIVEAIGEFDGILDNHSRFKMMDAAEAAYQKDLCREVFRRTTKAIKEAAKSARKRWKTSFAVWLQRGRFVWLPLNYGLRPEDYDTQAEYDAVLEELAGHKFSQANQIEYLINERFHPELKRMLLETEKYQVLIIHDFRHRTDAGDTDVFGWDMVTEGYMRAMINAVKALDRGEREVLPQFIMYIDQNFYQTNGSRPIITYLENIYTKATMDLKNEEIAQKVADTHRELMETIQNSESLRGVDEKRLAKAFKVHVSVTNPWDPAFALDISMRDHRKIAFRDVTELDPGKGEGILTGTGVGQHYQPPKWEDRAMIVRGPALVELKTTARNLQIGQGFDPEEVPEHLKPIPYPNDYDLLCEKLIDKRWNAPVQIVMNETGYGRKLATAQRAAIYNLAVSGSVLIAIDSLWLSDFWAEMFICAALRGANVYPVAPTPENAPASANSVLFIMRENFELMIEARKFFAEDLAKSGGAIHVGLYAHQYGVDDMVARGAALMSGKEKYPFVLEDLPFGDDVFDLVRERLESLKDDGVTAAPGGAVKPYVHMKTQFYGTEAGMLILRRPEWVTILRNYMDIREKQVRGEETIGLTGAGLVTTEDVTRMIEEFEAGLAAAGSGDAGDPLYAFTIGSMNMDRRGMVSDGEVLAIAGGYSALLGVLDMMFILVTSDWPQDASHFDEIFPDAGVKGTMAKITRYLQDMF